MQPSTKDAILVIDGKNISRFWLWIVLKKKRFRGRIITWYLAWQQTCNWDWGFFRISRRWDITRECKKIRERTLPCPGTKPLAIGVSQREWLSRPHYDNSDICDYKLSKNYRWNYTERPSINTSTNYTIIEWSAKRK